ncbi:NAD(P)H-dependent oxidoreductase [Bifidobacterium platyrrhinorum]|uniref:Flavodoxin family protein n=1 Tax=Bifidobacterium platyrrhinorum TaxID=2661628 RepID=A0A6L9SPX0_9BIFI|nr:NAD(P)H-dependent oxidoreductase [Bifidobacterium platyrrhinorum]NEG54560.1 flavodoxin family protein [Bifidobacterium platyrrhinorum]
MRTLVLVFHPDLEGASRANKALVRAARELPGDAVTVRDVYALYPDGVIDVAAEQRLVEKHDRIVLQFPMYWYSAPALLKEWEDKVLAFGWAYGPGGESMKGKEIAVATTAGGPESEYVEEDDGATMREVLSPYRMMARYTHAVWRDPFVVFESMELSDEALATAGRRYQAFLTD